MAEDGTLGLATLVVIGLGCFAYPVSVAMPVMYGLGTREHQLGGPVGLWQVQNVRIVVK